MIKICDNCNKEFNSLIIIDGVKRNLQNRRYCLECSPYGLHRTRPIDFPKQSVENPKFCSMCKMTKQPNEFYRRRKNTDLSPYCKICTGIQTTKRQRNIKVEAVKYKGNKCQNCGYDKCIAVLEFHHVNPSEKDYTISKRNCTSFEKIKDELDKCILLCKNCHGELHWKQKNS